MPTPAPGQWQAGSVEQTNHGVGLVLTVGPQHESATQPSSSQGRPLVDPDSPLIPGPIRVHHHVTMGNALFEL